MPGNAAVYNLFEFNPTPSCASYPCLTTASESRTRQGGNSCAKFRLKLVLLPS